MIDLAKTIEDQVLEENESRGRKYGPRENFWASEVFKCKRELYYKFDPDVPQKKLDARALMVFKAGDAFHELVKNYLWRSGMLRQEEAKLPAKAKEELNLTGRFDAMVSTTKKGKRELVEVKSVSHFGFEEMEEPKEQWVGQTTIYLHYLGVKRGIIFAINKNTSEMKQWVVEYDEKVFEKVKKYFSEVAKAIKKKKEPDREFPRDSWQCGYCKFNQYCWRDCPLPEPPGFQVDKAIEPPSQELLESAINTYGSLDRQIKELEKGYDEAKEIIKRYFKTNKEETVSSETFSIKRIQRATTKYDQDKLRKSLGSEGYSLIATPSSTLIKQFLKEQKIDPTAVEKAKIFSYSEVLQIKEVESNADKNEK